MQQGEDPQDDDETGVTDVGEKSADGLSSGVRMWVFVVGKEPRQEIVSKWMDRSV